MTTLLLYRWFQRYDRVMFLEPSPKVGICAESSLFYVYVVLRWDVQVLKSLPLNST
jgi:hypothetical protein